MKNNSARFIIALAIFALALVAMIAANPTPMLAASRAAPMPSAGANNIYGCVYYVRAGDTLFSIAFRHNTSTYALAAVNGLSNPNFIYSGMLLSVPCQATPPIGYPPPSSICRYHVVLRGEYLSLIASQFNTTWEALAQFNRLANPNFLYAGMRLAIPCGTVAPSGAGQWRTFSSDKYHYTVNYPADWMVQVNAWGATGPGTNPEYVTLAQSASSLPRLEIDALTGTPPFTGYENCERNFVFRNLPTCKISLAAGQNPASDIWVFQKGSAYFRIVAAYKDSSSTQVFNDIMTSFNFTQ